MAGPVETWFPFFIGEFHADTQGWTNAEKGAYVTLETHIWRSGGSVPYDEDRLARVIGDPWSPFWSVTKHLFLLENGALSLPRLSKHLDRAVIVQASLSDRNRKAVEKRWAKARHTSRNTSRMRDAMRGDTPSPSPSQLPTEPHSQTATTSPVAAPPADPRWGDFADSLRASVLADPDHTWAPDLAWAKARTKIAVQLRLAHERDGRSLEMIGAVCSRWIEIPPQERKWPESSPTKWLREKVPHLFAALPKPVAAPAPKVELMNWYDPSKGSQKVTREEYTRLVAEREQANRDRGNSRGGPTQLGAVIGGAMKGLVK